MKFLNIFPVERGYCLTVALESNNSDLQHRVIKYTCNLFIYRVQGSGAQWDNFVLTYVPGGFIDNKTQEKRHQRVKKETDFTFSRNFSEVWWRIQKLIWIWTSSKSFQPHNIHKQSFFDFFIRLCEQTAVFFITNIPGS